MSEESAIYRVAVNIDKLADNVGAPMERVTRAFERIADGIELTNDSVQRLTNAVGGVRDLLAAVTNPHDDAAINIIVDDIPIITTETRSA
jgi:hypothetical protein